MSGDRSACTSKVPVVVARLSTSLADAGDAALSVPNTARMSVAFLNFVLVT